MRFAWVWVALAALSGCHKGDGLVVVTVSSALPVQNIVTLKATATVADGAPHSLTVPTGGAPFDLPPAKTFGIDMPASLTGTLKLHLEADDASGALLAQGDGTT